MIYDTENDFRNGSITHDLLNVTYSRTSLRRSTVRAQRAASLLNCLVYKPPPFHTVIRIHLISLAFHIEFSPSCLISVEQMYIHHVIVSD